ncbi:hypothetical protein O2K51_05145 [Apibacter raozihei]|uniref:hypothetical protein n=1 Tax=Apibacter raozihei TaxID=2500547 RepID=UPI000FE37D1C|nr:hypothetical protein [Apibacter raozihei]
MKHIIPIVNELNKLSNEELLKNFELTFPKYGRFNYYPIFSKRSSFFKDILKQEVLKNENLEEKVFGNIRAAWLIVISILDYSSSDKFKKEIIQLIKKNWANSNYKDLENYTKNESRFAKYFN